MSISPFVCTAHRLVLYVQCVLQSKNLIILYSVFQENKIFAKRVILTFWQNRQRNSRKRKVPKVKPSTLFYHLRRVIVERKSNLRFRQLFFQNIREFQPQIFLLIHDFQNETQNEGE